MKKHQNKIKYIIVVIVFVCILIAYTARTINKEGDLNFFEKAIKDSVNFSAKIFYSPIKFVKDKVEIFNETKDLYEKYTALKEQEEKTELYYSQIVELQKEITELKSVLDLNATLSEYTYVNATIINRNIGYWYDTLGIDKGSKNGIKLGDAVITSNGLIGKISSVSNFSSTVKLLTTAEINNKISVKINSKDIFLYGLLVGYDSSKNVYKIEGITNYDIINEGDIVTTTGLTDYFPSGIIIGKVSKIVKDEYDLEVIIEVTPSVDFSNIGIVTVLNRKAKE